MTASSPSGMLGIRTACGLAMPLLWLSCAAFYSIPCHEMASAGCAIGFLGCLIANRISKSNGSPLEKPAVQGTAALAMMIPETTLWGWGGPEDLAALWVIGGIGAAVCLTGWFQAACHLSLSSALYAFVASFAGMSMVQGALSLTPLGFHATTQIVVAAAPVLSLLYFIAPQNGQPLNDDPAPEPLPAPAKGFVVGTGILIAILALFFGVSDHFPWGILGQPAAAYGASLALNLLTCALLALWLHTRVFSAEPHPLFMPVVVAVLMALLIALFFFRNDLFLLLGMQQTARTIVVLCLYFLAIALVKRGSYRPVPLFCIIFLTYRGFVAAGLVLGAHPVTGYLLNVFPHEGIYLLSACCAVLVGYLLLIAAGFYRETIHRQPSPATVVLETSFIDSRCDELGRQHHLSEREVEIVKLLCQGRSRSYIAESLYLSENTVKWYCRQIYQKLGIHKKQELLTLIGMA